MLHYNGVHALLALRNDVRSAMDHYQTLWKIARNWSTEYETRDEVQRIGRDLEKLHGDLTALVRDMAAEKTA